MQEGRISAGNALHLARFLGDGQWTEAERWLGAAASAARERQCNRVLLSSEWLLSALAREDGLTHLSACLERLGGHELELLLVLRDPAGQLISLYKHRAKAGTCGPIDLWVEDGYDLPERLEGLRRQVESSNVPLVVRAYGKERGSLAKLFFEDWLDVAVPEASNGLVVNPSLSLSELVLLRRLQALHPGLVPYLYERLVAVEPSMKREGQSMQDHARRVAAHAVSSHFDEWRYWNRSLPEDERFTLPEPVERPGPEPAQLELSATQLWVVMELLADAVRWPFRMQLFWSWRLRPLLARMKRLLLPWHTRR